MKTLCGYIGWLDRATRLTQYYMKGVKNMGETARNDNDKIGTLQNLYVWGMLSLDDYTKGLGRIQDVTIKEGWLCGECGTGLDPVTRTCWKCAPNGEVRPLICSNCGSGVDPDTRTCGECNANV